jgi:predicted GNAT superfamily acetyltransferase
VIIRHFNSISDHAQCERLQEEVWGGTGHLAVNMLVTIQRHGGLTLGAFDDAGVLQGCAVSFTSPSHAEGAWHGLSQHSHLAAVKPGLQSQGLGEKIKRWQAEATLAMGQNLMTWTYDPLESRNAYLNIHKLGAIVRKFIPDCYGPMTDDLNRGLPSDRFEPEWWLDADSRARWDRKNARDLFEIEIDPNFQQRKLRSLDDALAFRLAKRKAFQRAFADGYVVCDYVFDGGRAAYVLGRY